MKVRITFSAFDLFHACHVKMLEEIKIHCYYLICGLQPNPTIDRPEKNMPVQSVVERFIQLKGFKYVDEIITYVTEQDLEDVLRPFKIDFRFIGDEYANKQFTERNYCEQKRIELFFNKREHLSSSSGLRKEVQEKENLNNKDK
jgi:glycerol-3-phosphate cytidylyltransferase